MNDGGGDDVDPNHDKGKGKMHPAAIKRPASLSFAKLFNIKDLD